LTPFIEQMGPTTIARKEFWWEREWRRVGRFRVSWTKIVAVFAPEGDHDAFDDDLAQLSTARRPPIVDPRWGT
jgi:hypothetical protein